MFSSLSEAFWRRACLPVGRGGIYVSFRFAQLRCPGCQTILCSLGLSVARCVTRVRGILACSHPFKSHTSVFTIPKFVTNITNLRMAERVGFEPTKDFHPYRISSAAPSTTQPPLRIRIKNNELRIMVY